LAQYFHGTKKAATIIGCADYQEKHEVGKLIGAPPGYIGYDDKPRLSREKLLSVIPGYQPNSPSQPKSDKKEDKKELKFKDKTIKLSEPKVYKDERTSDKSVKMDIDVSNSKYGSISARQEKNGIMLIWTDNQGGFFQNIIDELIKIENRIANSEITDLAERVINSSSFIENNIRIENGKRYLVKFKNKDFKYGIIGINEQLKKEKYPIKSSGTEVFSNIYGIRIASQKEIKQYLGGQ